MKKSLVIERLSAIKQDLSCYGVMKVGLFGSTVRNESSAHSDVDVLVDFLPGKETYYNYLSVCDALEKIFGHTKVDVVTVKGLSPFVGDTILKEVEYV